MRLRNAGRTLGSGAPGLLALLVLLALLAGPGASPPAAGPDATPLLRVLSWNIRHGAGADGLDLERTARVIRAASADVVLLQEVDERCGRTGGVDQAAWLGERLGMEHRFAPFMSYDGGRYGLAVLSRVPIVRHEVVSLPPGRHEPRAALAVTIRPAGGAPMVTVINVHLDWLDDDTERFAQARTITAWQQQLDHPVILGGDLNDTPGSRTLALARERLPAGPPAHERATFPAAAPDREIDYVLARPVETWRVDLYTVIDERVASDHRPVLAALALRPRRAGAAAAGRAEDP